MFSGSLIAAGRRRKCRWGEEGEDEEGASGMPDSRALWNGGGRGCGGLASEFPDTAAGGQTVT